MRQREIIFSISKWASISTDEGNAMLDSFFIVATIVFFLIALAYVRGCEKLQ